MTDQSDGEFPWSLDEATEYSYRFASVLADLLGERLVCVLMYGSWSRDEGRPGESDVDVAIVIDTVDDEAHELMRQAWTITDFGRASVFGLDELDVMPREGLLMYLSPLNARLVYGVNPVVEADEWDFAHDLAQKAEGMAHEARCALYYPWLSVEGRRRRVAYALRRYLAWGAMNWIALLHGRFPARTRDLPIVLHDLAPLGPQIIELLGVDPAPLNAAGVSAVARSLNEVAVAWFDAIRERGLV